MVGKRLLLNVVFLVALAAAGMSAQDSRPADLRAADNAWDSGNYIGALTGYLRLAKSPASDEAFEHIALRTGELFVTEELTADGRNPRLSPDGRFVAYETGPAKSPMTRIQRVEGQHASVSDLPGTGVAFSRDGSKVAYLRANPSDELSKAQDALDRLSNPGPERTFAQQTLTRLQAKASTIVMRDLETQLETELKTGDLLKSSLVFGADSNTVYFVGTPEGETKRSDIYAVGAASAAPVLVSDAEGFKTAPSMNASGRALIVALPNQAPFPLPQPPEANASGTAPRGQRGAEPAATGGQRGTGGGGAPARFGVVDLATRKVTVVPGSAPAFSENGEMITYVRAVAADNFLMTMPVGGPADTVLKTTDRLAAPAFSLDGGRIVYQKMVRDDWEIFIVNSDGKEESRVTQDIQHDVVPRFISSTRILAASGEPRHRRAFIYDLPSMKQTRLFHNNTVRTIAPEYSWTPTPDGSKVLVSAERDGDTISTERGVYLVDLNRKITKAELSERLQKNLTSETLLREFAQRIFEPILDSVRKVVSEISTHRIYEYERQLVGFGSKHISMPGNLKAIDYITSEFKSFAYEPEQQWFEPRGALGGRSANVLARLTGSENPELIYTLSSHLDSVVAGPGADDDTSGIAALLEAARVMRGHPMPATIVFAAFTAEESGTLGSREFARIAKEKKWQVAGSLNNDMVGYANDSRLDNTIRYSNAGIRDIQHAAAMNFTKLITYDAHYYKGTDAAPLFEAFGDVLGGIGGYPVLSSPHYHTASDVLETINFEQVAETSKTTVATLMYLASTPSPVKNLSIRGTEVSWDPSPEKSVRSYVVSYGRREDKANSPRINIPGLKAGDVVMVTAVNAKGMPGWDWSRLIVPATGRN